MEKEDRRRKGGERTLTMGRTQHLGVFFSFAYSFAKLLAEVGTVGARKIRAFVGVN